MSRYVQILAPFVLVVVQACGGGSATPTAADGGIGEGGAGDAGIIGDLPLFRSGSRLRARTYALENGKSAFIDWYDSELEVDCRFRLAADGKTRCLPFLVRSDQYYLESCDELYAGVPATEVPKFVLSFANTAACAGPAVLQLGTMAPTPEQYYYQNEAVCTASSEIVPDWMLHFSTTPMDASNFVAATLLADQGPNRFGTAYWIAEDGAVEASSVYDRVRGMQCASEMAADGSLRCLPQAGTEAAKLNGNRFGIAPTCEQKLGSDWDPGMCEDLKYTVRTRDDIAKVNRCDDVRKEVYVNGEEVAAKLVGQGDACEPVTNRPPGYRYFELGTEVPSGEFAQTTDILGQDGRVVQRYRATSMGESLLAVGLYDTTLEADCWAGYVGDTLRCVPEVYTQISDAIPQYSDSACTMRVLTQRVSANSTQFCGLLPKVFAEGSETDACSFDPKRPTPGTCSFTELTSMELLQEATVYLKSGENCLIASVEAKENDVGIALLHLGGGMPAENLAALVGRIE